uniref:Cyanophycinase n=1 Tax=Cyanothece sp. (strain PCC 7425 / ATCC 29141) TaxID=395961 RepID=B8HME9_CYAP4
MLQLNMLQLDVHPSKPTMLQRTKSAVMAIGGAEDKIRGRHILQAFFQRAGSKDAYIAVIPSASREPESMGRMYQDIFLEMGAKAVEVFLVTDRAQGEESELLSQLQHCTGVFLSGGDQLRLSDLLADTPLLEQLKNQVWQGQTVLAGTSAGAAVLGERMIASGGSGEAPNRALVDMTAGLGIIPSVIVDQHFYNRNRLARLISAIAAYPDKLGIGIDEDTCALFEADGLLQVLGKGAVTIVDPRDVTHTNHDAIGLTDPLSIYNLRLHVLSHGDCYDLHRHEVLSQSSGLPPFDRSS